MGLKDIIDTISNIFNKDSIDNNPPKDYTKVNPMVIDVSHWNTIKSYATLRQAGIVGAIIKSSQGTGYVDKTFVAHRKAAKEAGMLVGAYHFGDGKDVGKQVENFLTASSPYEDLLLCLDFEDNPNGSSTMNLEQAKEFIVKVKEKTGKKVVLYGGSAWLREKIVNKRDPLLAECPLWLASYGKKVVIPAPWKHYWLWQYTDGANGPLPRTLPGVSGKVDINSYPGTPAQLRKEWEAYSKGK